MPDATPSEVLLLKHAFETALQAAAPSVCLPPALAGYPRKPALVLGTGKAQGLSADNYSEAAEGELVPIPLPWGSWLERRYQWDGKRFAMRGEVPAEHTSTVTSTPAVASAARRMKSTLMIFTL